MKKIFTFLAALALVNSAAAQEQVTLSPTHDTYVRKGKTDKYGTADAMEFGHKPDGSSDFVGLMSFDIPATPAGSQVASATLILTTERIKGERNTNIYQLATSFDEASVVYADVESAIVAARQTTPLASCRIEGQGTKSVALDEITNDNYKNITAWQNSFTLTDFVTANASKSVALMIDAANDNNNNNKIFTKEAKDGGNNVTYTAEQVTPKLVITYEKAGVITGAVINETQQKGFADLPSALSAAAANDVLIVNETQTIGSRLEIDKALTVKAGAEGVAITRGEKNTGLVVLMKTGGELTLEGIVLDGAGISVNAQYLEAAAGTVTLKDCVVKNNVSTNAKGSICAKSTGKIIIDGCAFTNNTASAENAGIVFNGSSLTLKGNVTFTGNTGNDIYLEKYVVAAKADIAWETPITLFHKSPAEGTIAVGGGAWEKGTTAFSIANPGWYLYVKEGSTNGDVLLTQTKPTGIADITVTHPDNVTYNMAGQRVGAGAKGILIRNGKKIVVR